MNDLNNVLYVLCNKRYEKIIEFKHYFGRYILKINKNKVYLKDGRTLIFQSLPPGYPYHSRYYGEIYNDFLKAEFKRINKIIEDIKYKAEESKQIVETIYCSCDGTAKPHHKYEVCFDFDFLMKILDEGLLDKKKK